MTKLAISSNISQYLQQTVIPIRLGCVDYAGWNVVVSLWYLYHDGLLYCATKQSAKIVSYLQATPRCGFEVAADEPPYCGVRGKAHVTIDEQQGQHILEKLLIRYLGSTDTPLGKKLLANSQDEVAIVLSPIQLSSWNYSKRMKHENNTQSQKVCP